MIHGVHETHTLTEAESVPLPYKTAGGHLWVCSRWPERRACGVIQQSSHLIGGHKEKSRTEKTKYEHQRRLRL